MDIDSLAFFGVTLTARRPTQMVDNPKVLGDHLKNQQLKLGISQNEMARRIGVDEENVINWILRGLQPHISFCPNIIKFLGYNPFPSGTSTLAGRMKKYRIEHGLSQEKLAKIIGVDIGSISDWEIELRKPLPSKRKILEEFLNQNEPSN